MGQLSTEDLRWLLLGLGGVIVIGIYLWGMRTRIRERLARRRRRAAASEPVLGEDETLDDPQVLEPASSTKVEPGYSPQAGERLVDVEIRPVRRESGEAARPEPAPEPAPRPRAEPKAGKDGGQPQESMAVALTVVAPQGRFIAGSDLLAVAGSLGFTLHEDGLMDFTPATDSDASVFRMANILKPGVFKAQDMDAMATPGVVLFMQLPGPIDANSAMELMVKKARELAERLGATVCDERRNKMTPQSILHLRGLVNEFERRRRAWSPSR